METPGDTSGESLIPQREMFEDFDYVDFGDSLDPRLNLENLYVDKGFFSLNTISQWDFEKFLNNFFQENNLDEYLISGTAYKNDTFFIYFSDGGEKTEYHFSYKELQGFLFEQSLNGEKQDDIEKRAHAIGNAIEAIYTDNDGIIFQGEIDHEDIVDDELITEYSIASSLKGKNLNDLKALLDVEHQKLFRMYEIVGETHKKQELLKKEVLFYAGIGDKYEGGAFYFGLTTKEIKIKVAELGSSMTMLEMFDYIKTTNKAIDDNLRRARIVDQVNLKFIHNLYDYTFKRLKKENATSQEFIAFVKLITGRGELKNKSGVGGIGQDEIYSKRQKFKYEDLDVDETFKAQNIANKALIHAMYMKGGLLEDITNENDTQSDGLEAGTSPREKHKKIDLKLEDSALEGRTPSDILNETRVFFDSSVDNEIPGHGTKMLLQLGYTQSLAKPYADLNFEEKINIGALARILKKLKSVNVEDLQDAGKLQELSDGMVKDAFLELNDSFSDNFDASLFDWNGESAEDFGLTGTSAEIFELYQDINGNNGLLDFKDSNELGLGTIVLGISLVAGIIILGPILSAGAGAFAFNTALRAGFKVGAISGIASNVLSRKGYNTYSEGVLDVGGSIFIDAVVGALATGTGLYILRWNLLRILSKTRGEKKPLARLKKAVLDGNRDRLGKTGLYNADLFFSKNAWKASGLADKGFIGAEVGATMYVGGKVDSAIKRSYEEHYTDTDLKTGQ